MKKLVSSECLFFCIAVFCFSALGGGHLVGNTTSFLLCTHGNRVSYQMYDVYEARFFEGLDAEHFDYGSGRNYLEKAKSIISSLARLNPTRYRRYLSFINSFPYNALIKTVYPKNKVSNDNTLSLIPEHCQLIPVIINNIGYYEIDGHVWYQLTENQKAAAIVHEAIYNEALMMENAHQNSYFVRIFTRHLLANSFKNMSLKNYLQFIQNIRLVQADAHGFLIALNHYDGIRSIKLPVEYWDEYSVKKANLYWNGKSSAHGIPLKYDFIRTSILMKTNSFVSFYPSHQVEIFKITIGPGFNSSYERLNKFDLSKIGFRGEMIFNYIHFSNEGKILSVRYLDFFPIGTLLKLDFPGAKIEVVAKQPLFLARLEATPFESIGFTNVSKNICQEQLRDYSTNWKPSNVDLSRKLISITLKKNAFLPQSIEKIEWCD